MELLRTLEGRDALSRVRRLELVKFANKVGVLTDKGQPITEEYQADDIRAWLRRAGYTKIPDVPLQTYGRPSRPPIDHQAAVGTPVKGTVVADEVWRDWKKNAPKPAKSSTANAFVELRRECKRRGIKYARTDKADDLRAKLNGQDAAQRG